MNSRRFLSACSIIALALSSSALAQTPPLPEPLQQYVSNLQKTPNDIAAKESNPEAIAAKQQREYAEWLGRIDGRRYTNPVELGATGTLDVKGKVLVTGIIVAPDSPIVGPRGYTEHDRHEIRDREAAGPVQNVPDLPGGSLQIVYIISEEGDRITQQLRFGDGTIRENIFFWQR